MPQKNHQTGLEARLAALDISVNAVTAHFDTNYGTNDSKLEAWQQLCRDIGVNDKGTSVTQCKKHLKGKFVNIFDFVEAQENGTKVGIFKSARALAEYTKRERKVFPLARAKKNPILRWMLVHLRF